MRSCYQCLLQRDRRGGQKRGWSWLSCAAFIFQPCVSCPPITSCPKSSQLLSTRKDTFSYRYRWAVGEEEEKEWIQCITTGFHLRSDPSRDQAIGLHERLSGWMTENNPRDHHRPQFLSCRICTKANSLVTFTSHKILSL